MKRRTRFILLFLAMAFAIFSVAAVTVAWLFLDPNSPVNHESAISATREWARVAEFPPSTRNLRIRTEGSMFTREFIIEFEASPSEVARWIANSPGLSQVQPTAQDDGSHHYKIVPGGGAQFAEAYVWREQGRVRLRAFWS